MNKLTRMTDSVRAQDSNFFAYIVTALLRITFALFTYLGNSLLIFHTQPPQETLSQPPRISALSPLGAFTAQCFFFFFLCSIHPFHNCGASPMAQW